MNAKIGMVFAAVATVAVTAAAKPSSADTNGVVRLDLSEFCNMGFEDESEGDERGGWHDHGETDARKFPILQERFCRVPFKIVNPAENVGNSIVVFRHPKKRDGATEVSVDVRPAAAAKYLNLLHCSAWATWRGDRTGDIVVTDEKGEKAVFPVLQEQDVKEWWAFGVPKFEKNAFPAVQLACPDGNGYCYCSEFRLPDGFGKVANVTFKGAPMDKTSAYWMLVAATLTPEQMRSDVPEKEPPPYVVADDNMYQDLHNCWRDFHIPALNGIVKGSVLDYAAIRGDAPKKRVVLDRDEYRYEGETNAVRFMLVNCELAHPGRVRRPDQPNKKISFGQYIGKGITTNSQDDISNRINALADRGYNALFVSGNGGVWQEESEPNGLKFATCALPDRDFGIKVMKERGLKRLMAQTRESGYWAYAFTNRGDTNRFERMGEIPACLPGSPRRDRTLQAMEHWATQKNALTGDGWLSDPDVLAVLMWNECDRLNLTKFEFPFFVRAMERKYGTVEKLREAWGNPPGSETWNGFNDLRNDSWAFMNDCNQRGLDYFEFILGMCRENVAWFENACRGRYGCTAPFCAYDMTKSFFHSLCREDMRAIYMHVYQSHPMSAQAPGLTDIAQESPIASANSFFRNMVATQYDTKPMFVTEMNVCYWNQYRYEQPFVAHAYAALNGFDGMLTFLGIGMGPRHHPRAASAFFSGSDPVVHATEFLAMHIFRGGAVRTSPVTVRLRFSEEEMRRTFDYRYAPNVIQTKLGLVFRFALETPKTARPMTPNDVMITTAKGAKMRNEKLFSLVVEDKNDTSFDIEGFLKEMKAKGLLPKTNRTDPKRNIWESCTGEMYMDCNRKLGVLDTPTVKGVFAPKDVYLGNLAKLGDFEIVQKTNGGALCAVGVDGRPIARSKRLCVVYATNALTRGTVFKDETMRTSINPEVYWKGDEEKIRRYSREMSRGGIIYDCGTFAVKLRNENAPRLRCWAVALDGSRTEELPVEHLGDDLLRLEVNVRNLLGGPAVFFELAEK